MAGIKDYKTSASLNTAVGGVNISENMARSDVNNAMRAMMADVVKAVPVVVTVRDLGAKCDGVTDDGAIINAEIYARYNGLATSQSQEFVEIHASAGDVLKFATPVTVRQNRIRFIGNGAKIVCTGAYAFDITQDGSGNDNQAGAIIDWKITGATTAAIRATAANFWEFKDNWITANAIGISLNGCIQARVENNYIRENTGVGLYIAAATVFGGGIVESQRCHVENNEIWLNGGYGLHLVNGVGHLILGNDFEVNTGRDVYIQAALGMQFRDNYGEPAAGATHIYMDNTAGLVVGRTTAKNNFDGWLIGGGATWDINIVAGNSNQFENIVYGTGNINIAAGASANFIGPAIGSAPTVTNAGTGTILWHSPGYLGGIKALAGSATIGKNFTGYVDIAGAATTSAVTLTTEPDAAYHVLTNVSKVGGTPTAGSYNSHLSTFPTTTGFTIELDAAPGVGNTVRVWWMIVRP